VIENLRFAVGILMMCYTFKDSGVAKGDMGACLLPSYLENSICLRLLGASPPDPHRGSAHGPRWGTSVPQTPVLCPRSKFLATPLFRDISTSGLGGHIAISGCPSSSKLLSLNSPWLILSGSQLKRNTFDYFLSKRLEAFLPQAQQVCVKIEAQYEG